MTHPITLFGITATVASEDASRLTDAAQAAAQALQEQPGLLTKLDVVHREQVANSRAIRSVLATCVALLHRIDGQQATHDALRALIDEPR